MNRSEQFSARVIASVSTALLVLYCGAVLFYVATSADLGIRCLLTNDSPLGDGVQIRRFEPRSSRLQKPELPEVFGEQPQPGDRVVRIGDHEIRSFTDFAYAQASLRSVFRREPAFDSRVENTNPLDIDRYASLPPVIDYYTQPASRTSPLEEPERLAPSPLSDRRQMIHGRYIRIEYQRPETGELHRAWLPIQTLPSVEVILSIIWCLLEFGIFAVAALALCHRPRDSSARLFFALSLVTLPAFVGGYHWWVIAASPWLIGPFVVCVVLLPVVTLHFFLSYPARHWTTTRLGSVFPWLLYFPAAVMLLVLTGLLVTVFSIPWEPQLERYQGLLLIWMRMAIDIYISIALGYFVASVVCLFENYRRARQPSERKQLEWILAAAVAAMPLVCYAAYLAYADRVGLALGRGRIPMVIVSLLFLTAYAIGILRYRLMLLDQMLSQHTLYLILSQVVTLSYSLLIAFGSLLAVYRGMSVPEQLFPLAIFLTLGILGMGWLRDTVQQIIDRRFFREKYRLDRAMQQMNLVVAQMADVKTLADHMLRSCLEVLQVRFSALYLRGEKSPDYQLICAVGGASLPEQIRLEKSTGLLLEQTGSSQRTPGPSQGANQQLQQLHRDLNSQLLHGIEVNRELGGVVVLGGKLSSTPFTAEDTTFVAAIGQMTGVALQCVTVQQTVSELKRGLDERLNVIESQRRQIAILQSQLAAHRPEEAPSRQTSPDADQFDRGKIRGSSPIIIEVLNSARKVARSDSSVLIRGESGTGKELLASALHNNSLRRGGPFVGVNCAALSPSLLESELFGHVKGAFTGAYKDTAGRFQMADRGTLFLDEIGDVSADMQVKLLRVLQERRFEPVGGRESIAVDVRLIAATHQNLEQLMREGQFREDLYYRLNVITLKLPALRERKEDIFELAIEFLREATDRAGKSIRDIDDLAVKALLNYDWPGNIRELHNAIQRAVVLAETDCILEENLPSEVRLAETSEFAISRPRPRTLPRLPLATPPRSETPADAPPDRGEQAELLAALSACGGNKAQAARFLGMPRSTFYSKLKKYHLE